MKYYNVTFKWYDTDTYCSNLAKAECIEDVKAHYAKYDSAPTIKDASNYDVEAAEKRGKPIVTCPHIEAPAEAEAEAEPEQTDTESSAAALYDGGWRSTDKAALIAEYELTEDEAEAICKQLAKFEEEEKNAMKTNIIDAIKKEIEAHTERSAWSKGVTAYAVELLEDLKEAIDGGYFDVDDLEASKLLERALLNGADDWNQYSWGGCSLIYNSDIAERLCCPSELKKTRNGERRPNSREEWLDVQARALYQACNRVKRAVRAALMTL